MFEPGPPNRFSLLTYAVDMILNRIRLLAREMCPTDREKLEQVMEKVFADLSQIMSIESQAKRSDTH